MKVKYVAKIKYHGNHRFAGETVMGILEKREDGFYIYDETVISESSPYYGQSYNEWYLIDENTLKKLSKKLI